MGERGGASRTLLLSPFTVCSSSAVASSMAACCWTCTLIALKKLQVRCFSSQHETSQWINSVSTPHPHMWTHRSHICVWHIYVRTSVSTITELCKATSCPCPSVTLMFTDMKRALYFTRHALWVCITDWFVLIRNETRSAGLKGVLSLCWLVMVDDLESHKEIYNEWITLFSHWFCGVLLKFQ